MSIEVSSPGLIKLRILKANNTDISSMKKQENKIYFNVSDGYIVDTYTCTSGDYSYDNINDTLTISNTKDNTICNVSYKEGYKKLYDIIMGQPLVLNNGLRETTSTNSGSSVFYYRGQVENNYVELEEKEGSALYRIVRTNEDGSIRLIRQEGINNNATYAFNPNYNSYEYMYYSNSNVEGGIMKRINDWYASSLEGTSTSTNIVESSFCEQAKTTWYNNSGDTLTAGSQTMIPATNDYVPSLKCVTDANGKGSLSLKAGLLTADEVVYAGYPFYTTTQVNNQNIYLHKNNYWRTISPSGFASLAYVKPIDPKGTISTKNGLNVAGGYVTRPVLSISKTTEVTGLGTASNPFKIK